MQDINSYIDSRQEKKKLAKTHREFEFFDDAIDEISGIITDLESLLKDNEQLSDKNKTDLNNELADCYGIQGGIYRRWGLKETGVESRKNKFLLSAGSYDTGYECEKKGNKPVSYNRLNRLISRIFYEPSWLASSSPVTSEKSFLAQELYKSARAIEEEMQKGRTDIWGLADLALNKILLKEIDAVSAFSGFVEKSPASSDYTSVLDVLKPLSELPIDPRNDLQKAVLFLETRNLGSK